jgi:hypothetical protein
LNPLDTLAQLRLDDGRLWLDAAHDFQLSDVRAALDPDAPPYPFGPGPAAAPRPKTSPRSKCRPCSPRTPRRGPTGARPIRGRSSWRSTPSPASPSARRSSGRSWTCRPGARAHPAGSDPSRRPAALRGRGIAPGARRRWLRHAALPAQLTYAGPTGERFNMQATIRGKDGGNRWLVIGGERHKSAGPPPR